MPPIKNQRIKKFLSDSASKRPVPGGGSVSALAAALAAALVAKVARLTAGKKGYEKHWQEFEKIILQADSLTSCLADLADQDAKAYKQVMEAYHQRNNKTEEKTANVVANFNSRQKAVDQALKQAAEVPLQTAQKAKEVLELARFAFKHGNKNATSDTQVAISLAQAAIKGAVENVKVNLREIKDQGVREEIEQKLELLNDLV